MPDMDRQEESNVSDAPHPWEYHDPGETDTPPRITDDNGDEVTLGRAWREVQLLRACRDRGVGYEGIHGLGCDCTDDELKRLRDGIREELDSMRSTPGGIERWWHSGGGGRLVRLLDGGR